MINKKSLSLYFLLCIITLSFVLSLQTKVKAEDIDRIAQTALETTVQINNSLSSIDSPGGSGVIISKQDKTYTVLTANHVVCNKIPDVNLRCRTDISYSVRTADGKDHLLDKIENIPKTENDTDIALGFFTSEKDYPVAKIGDSDQAQLGSDVYVAGFPTTFQKFGQDRDFNFTRGAVVSRPNNISQGYNLVYDARTKVGMSGGPVFDLKRRVVGIHGRGDGKETTTQTESGLEKIAIKSGFNAGIPINAYKTNCQQISTCSEIEVDSSDTGENLTALIDNPETARDYYKRGLRSQATRDYSGAIANYSKALVLNPDRDTKFLIHFNTGYVHLLAQRWQDSIDSYSQAINIEPNDAKAHSERGDARRGLDDFAGAIADYNRAIELEPSFADAYNNRAFIHNRQQNYEQAKADLEKAAQLYLAQGRFQEHEIVSNNLIRVQRNQGNQNTSPPIPPTVAPSNPTPVTPPVVDPTPPSFPVPSSPENEPI